MAVNVLVVDDSGVMRSMIIKAIRLSGLQLGEVHQAANGREGLEALHQHWIDLVIADINMPVMNGEEMIDRMLDAFKELTNVICGNALPAIAGDLAEFNIKAPVTLSSTDARNLISKGTSACVVRLALEEGYCDVYLFTEEKLTESAAMNLGSENRSCD